MEVTYIRAKVPNSFSRRMKLLCNTLIGHDKLKEGKREKVKRLSTLVKTSFPPPQNYPHVIILGMLAILLREWPTPHVPVKSANILYETYIKVCLVTILKVLKE